MVLPRMIAPAARTAATLRWSAVGTFEEDGLPWVVRSPSVSSRSFTPSGRPCSGGRPSPYATAASATLAAARVQVKVARHHGIHTWSTATIRAIQLARCSVGASFFCPISRRAVTALRSHGSVMAGGPMRWRGVRDRINSGRSLLGTWGKRRREHPQDGNRLNTEPPYPLRVWRAARFQGGGWDERHGRPLSADLTGNDVFGSKRPPVEATTCLCPP